MTVLEIPLMPPFRKTPYASTNLTVPARDRLRSAALHHSARADRRLSMSAVLLAALAVAEAHPEEWASAIDSADSEGNDS